MELSAAVVAKYKTNSEGQLLNRAQKAFNAFIRHRDRDEACINCSRYTKLQAGHLYPTSTFAGLRFDEENCHGECLQCNFYNSQSHSYGYRVNLEKKIGKERMEALELRASMSKRRGGAKESKRLLYIEVIEKYK